MDTQSIAKQVFSRLSLMDAHLKEHGIEPFYELARLNPAQAVNDFPKTLDRILDVGNGFYSGKMCGGPFPGATIPLLNVLGGIYPNVSKELREEVLWKAMNFLDMQNYYLSQDNVSGIDEPLLVRDIILTRPLYWPGYQKYADTLKDCVIWSDVESLLIKKTDKGDLWDTDSIFWLAYTLSHNEHSNSEIREAFSANFPSELDRTKDTIACWKAGDAACQHLFNKKEYLPVRHGKNVSLIEFLSGEKSKI